MPRRFDPAKVARVAALTLEGYSTAQIADVMGMSDSAVGRHRARAGIKAPPRRGRSIKCDVERVVALTRAGYKAGQISQLLGVHERTVQRYRQKRGLTKQYVKPLSEDQKLRAAVLLDDGASAAEAARTVGCSDQAIRRAFPGRAWTRQQVSEYISATRRFRGILERSVS